MDSFGGEIPTDGDLFGAAIDTFDDLAVIGAPGAAFGVGRATVARRSTAMRWNSLQELAPSFTIAGFGQAVAIEDQFVAVAAPERFTTNFGIVFMYGMNRGQWQITQVLGNSTGDSLSGFGTSLAFDGDRLYIGAPDALIPGSTNRNGAVFVFQRDDKGTSTNLDDTWDEVESIYPTSNFSATEFGTSIAMDGTELAIGAPRYQKLVGRFAAIPIGAAMTFRRQGGAWVQKQILTGSKSSNEGFGRSIALSGRKLLVGAPSAQDGALKFPGAGFAFDLDTKNRWVLNEKLFRQPKSTDLNAMGFDVDLVGDLAIVGAPYMPGSTSAGTGRAYAYHFANGSWEFLRAMRSDTPHNQDFFGSAVALTGGDTTGDLALVGALGQSTSFGAPFAGQVNYRGTSLEGCAPSIQATSGGTHRLSLAAGPAHAGEAYWVFGSATGTSPGLVIYGYNFPLVFDAYFAFTLVAPNSSFFKNFVGTLDANGNAIAELNVPADASLSGVTVYHAFLTASSLGGASLFASHAVALRLN